MKTEFLLQTGSFDDVLPVWKDALWPGRKSPIQPVSPIDFDFQYNEQIRKAAPSFWLVRSREGRLAGVVSGYGTGRERYRSRGLFVAPEFRGRGLSRLLLEAVCAQAQEEDCHTVWTLPRQSAWPAYTAFGFRQLSAWTEEGMEFGPNCLAALELARRA